MTKKEILQWFTINNESLDANKILFVLGMGIIVAAIIFMTYRITYSGVNYNAKFNIGNVVMLLIAAVIMLMISTNIAISLGPLYTEADVNDIIKAIEKVEANLYA